MSDEQLRSLATISVNGLPGNPTLPEDKAIRSILDTVNKSVTVFIEFVCSTKEPINKRTQACIEICNLHSALNDLARLYTKNVCTRNTEEEILTQVQNSVKDSVDLALNNAAAPPTDICEYSLPIGRTGHQKTKQHREKTQSVNLPDQGRYKY
jgi:hypothetical protein